MRIIWGALVALCLIFPVTAVGEAVMGDDGLHKTDWMRDTFKDLREDLEEANAEGKRLAIIIEQRGCIYCNKMHEDVFPVPEIDAFIHENFFFVQLNLFGDVGVTDFDGEELTEKQLGAKWGLLFTPTILYFPEDVTETVPGNLAAVATIPGAFGKYTTLNMMRWVVQHGYDGDESFQKFHARMLTEAGLN